MTVSGLTIQSVLLRIAPTTPQVLGLATAIHYQEKYAHKRAREFLSPSEIYCQFTGSKVLL